MKHANLSKAVGAGVLSLSLAVLPLSLPASAQTDTQSSPTTTQPSPTTEDTTKPTFDTTPLQETKDAHNNWGWLGLIGLIGLANLFRKPKTSGGYSEPNAESRGNSR
jgi:hypothetical protein